jgi:hypothetical protein
VSYASSVALLALVVIVALYALEHRSPRAQPGFAAASAIVAVSEFVLGRSPLAMGAINRSGVAVVVGETTP